MSEEKKRSGLRAIGGKVDALWTVSERAWVVYQWAKGTGKAFLRNHLWSLLAALAMLVVGIMGRWEPWEVTAFILLVTWAALALILQLRFWRKQRALANKEERLSELLPNMEQLARSLPLESDFDYQWGNGFYEDRVAMAKIARRLNELGFDCPDPEAPWDNTNEWRVFL